MERHEHLAGRDYLRDTKLYAARSASLGDDVNVRVRQELQSLGVARIHFEPRVWREVLQDGDLRCFCSCVPMFHGSTGIQNERIVLSGLLGERFPLDGK